MTRIRGARPPGPAAVEPLPRRSTVSALRTDDAIAPEGLSFDEAAFAYDALLQSGSGTETPAAPARRGFFGWLSSGREALGSMVSALASSKSGAVLGSMLGAAALVGAGGPALAATVDNVVTPDPAPSVRVAPTQAQTSYQVVKGDTLSGIAAKHGVSLAKVLLYNEQIENPNLIHPGQHIVIPPHAKVAQGAGGAAHQGTREVGTTTASNAAASSITAAAAAASTAHAASTTPAAAASTTPAASATPAAAASTTPAAAAVTPAAATTPASTSAPSRILRWLDTQLTDAATRSSTRVRHSVDLGVLGQGDLELKPLVRVSTDYTATRAQVEATEKAAGRDVMWLETTLGAKLTPPTAGVIVSSATLTPNAELELSITRPLAYQADDARLPSVVARFGQRLTTAPLSADALLSLETGSRVVLRGEGSLASSPTAAAGTTAATTPTGAAKGRLELRLDRLAGTQVEARLSTLASGTALTDAHGVRLDGALSRTSERSFTLDLSTAAGKSALSALLHLDGAEAQSLAGSAGVTLGSSTTVTAGNLGALHTTDGGVRAAARTSLEDRVDGTSHTRTRTTTGELGRTATADHAGFSATASHETRATGEGSRPTSEADLLARTTPASIDTTTRAGLGGTWNNSTATPSTVRAALEHRTVLERTTTGGERRETGSLELGGKLVQERGQLGGDYQVRYELRTPLGQPAPSNLPLDAEAFRALPATSRLELVEAKSATGSLRATHDTASVDLSGSASTRSRVVVTRTSGDGVEVSVVRYGRQEHKAAGALTAGPTERRVTLGVSDAGNRSVDVDRTYTLDLSKPAHAAAFARLLEGDVEKAAPLLGVEAPAVTKNGMRELGAKLGVEAPDKWSMGLELTRRVHEPTAALVTGSADRAAYAAANGPTRWTERVGLIAPKVSHTITAVPVADGSLKAGLSAEGLVELRSITPENDGRILSLDADDVLRWSQGSEVSLRGRGRATGFVDLGVGHSVTAGPATLAARAGLSESHAADKSYVLGVRRTEGTRVAVELRETTGSTDAFSGFARAGVTTDLKLALDLPAGSTRNDAIIKVLEKTDRAVGQRLAASIEGSLSKTTERDHKTEIEVDLAQPQGRSVFEALIHFDAENARILAGTGLTVSDTDTLRRNTHVGASISDWDAFRYDTARTDAHTRATGPTGNVVTDASSYRATSKTIFGRERALDWQAVSVQRDGAAQPELMYRVQFQDKDDLTSKRQVESLMSLVNGMELSTTTAPRIERAADRGWTTILGEHARHGKTEVALDVYLSHSGIESLRNTKQEAAWKAFGEVITQRTGTQPGWARTDVGAQARVMLAEHVDHPQASSPRDTANNDNADYWWLTGRNLWQDTSSFEEARSFTEMVRDMGNSTSPAVWNRAFADLGEDTGYPFYDALATMRRLTGPEGVLVKRLHMTGPAVNIEAVGTGFVEVPRP